MLDRERLGAEEGMFGEEGMQPQIGRASCRERVLVTV